MDDPRLELLTRDVAALTRHQQAHAVQLAQITRALKAMGVTPSEFAGLAQDVGGSLRMTKRIWRAIVAVATGAAALFAAFHYGQTRGAPAAEPTAISTPAPLGEE